MPEAVEYRVPLARLPAPFPFEAPSSWVCRAALSQGESLKAFFSYVEIALRGDVDLRLCSSPGVAAMSRLGLATPFPLARVIFGRVCAMKGGTDLLLLRDDTGGPSYRYCIHCLRAHRTPHFEIHGRFVAWRFCPLHDCLLQEGCPHCRAPISLPIDMLSSGPDRAGIAFLSECRHCGKSLKDGSPMGIYEARLSPWEHVLLKNGRASMAALLMGSGRALETGREVSLKALARSGLLPLQNQWPAASELRERMLVASDIIRQAREGGGAPRRTALTRTR